jgi:hypothetical protein
MSEFASDEARVPGAGLPRIWLPSLASIGGSLLWLRAATRQLPSSWSLVALDRLASAAGRCLWSRVAARHL